MTASVAQTRSWHDGFQLVLFAPLGKSVLTITPCFADMKVKTLNLSKPSKGIWGVALVRTDEDTLQALQPGKEKVKYQETLLHAKVAKDIQTTCDLLLRAEMFRQIWSVQSIPF